MSFALIGLGGCGLLFDPNDSTPGVKSLDGFKVCYSDNNYQVDDTFERYSAQILTSLANVFGVPNGNPGIESAPLASNAKNYDRIRVQYNGGPAISTAWNWTFAQSFAGAESQTQQSEVLAYYTNEKMAFYVNEFVGIYKIPLSAIAMQIASGQTPQTFVVDVNQTTGQTKVFTNQAKTQEVNEDYLQTEKTKFAQHAQYVGFTAENLTAFKNYILTNVVGAGIIGTQYDSVITTAGTKTYSALLDEILALSTGFEKEFLNPFPASSVKDVLDTSLYPLSGQVNTLANITPYEYQSITLMPNKTLEILSLSLTISAESQMNIDIAVYYNDNQTQSTLYEGTVNVRANQEYMHLVPFENIVEMAMFNNTETKITTPSQITNTNGLSRHFAFKNGAVLDTNQSYLTITFKPQGADSAYMPFKVAISSLFIGE